jgi:signal transduction histidine kinase
MIIRRTLSTKILMTLLPLFLGAVAVSIYLTYHYQQQHALEQMQAAARTQATIIKESLVQMMVNAQRVDDSYLQRIGQTSDVEQIGIWFYADSLHLEPDLLSPARLQRLRARELKANAELQPIADRVFLAAEQQWLIQCTVGTHTEGLVHVLSSGRPFVLHSCERLKVILPFTADRRCQECHMVPEGTVLGAAYMEMPLERTVRAIASNAERTLWIFGIFTVIALGIGAVLFRAFVSRPIKRLVRATQIIGKGNLDHPIAEEFAPDEFGELAHSFDRMQQQLKESQEKLLHQERLSAVGRMASTIIHDLRSPLNVVLLALERVNQHDNAAEQKLLAIVQTSILRINRMAQELLDFSSGTLRLDRREVNVSDFLRTLTAEISPTLEQQRIRLTTTLGVDGTFIFDPDRLHRALLNIITNAIDVLPSGGEIALSVRHENGSLLFTISDNGPGIPKEIEDRIFDPFVTAGKAKGTGLGLSITKEIVELHGGSVSFKRRPTGGTTFIVAIPTAVRHEMTPHAVPVSSSLSTSLISKESPT